ncbi:MAG: DNA translocase FtsK 4TM domain-containing protein [Patescibacteria group bacterium]|jgi:S-DNA-T family DNA segregation ATPase FtsK/SpoIIIE
MAQRKRKIQRIKGLRDLDFSRPGFQVSSETKRGILIVLLLAFGAVAILSLFNLAGTLGVYLNSFLKILFGAVRWYLPVVLIIVGYFLLRPAKYEFKTSNVLGLFLFIFSFNGLVHLVFHADDLVEAAKIGLGGGYSGLVLAWLFLRLMGFWAALVVLLALTIIGFILLFESYLINLLEKRRDQAEEEEDEEADSWISRIRDSFTQRKIRKVQAQRERSQIEPPEPEPEEEELNFSQHEVEVEQAGSGHRAQVQESEEEKEDRQLDLGVSKFKQTKIDLPLDLLTGKTTTPNGGDLKANKMIIEKTLENFGIRVEMGEAQVGPTVTQYTLKPAEGVKLSRITALADNLALALAAHPIRIEAPIPGRSLVGVEVPNQAAAIVPLKDIISSEPFKGRKTNLTVALGKDVMGRPWLADLAKMPHLLIAGATGSGKSVCINSIILTLLFENGPGDLKFIMVDPKRVELPIYNSIPHLLTPVIIDVRKTINALRWTIKEMEKRFDTLAASHHRNIESYNNEAADKMPYIVFVIDELADLMASAGAEVEAAIVRLAQMSRAVGIHLVLATQRPSVDVLTGLIKANITSRVAFSVASLVDSRTILDMSGAEKLLGKGDMLYISAEISKPKRLQGAFASDDEIKRVTEYLKDRSKPDYIEEVVEKQQTGFSEASNFSGDIEDGDPLLPEAKEVIVRAKKASASLLQRRLRIGYARAARILDLLEEQGVIGPGDGAKPREVLINHFDGDTIENTSDDEIEEEEEDFEEDEEEQS